MGTGSNEANGLTKVKALLAEYNNRKKGKRLEGVCKMMMDHRLKAGRTMDSKRGEGRELKVPRGLRHCWRGSHRESRLSDPSGMPGVEMWTLFHQHKVEGTTVGRDAGVDWRNSPRNRVKKRRGPRNRTDMKANIIQNGVQRTSGQEGCEPGCGVTDE